jgi:glycosyltransferase involved in cell wall biosynthesis
MAGILSPKKGFSSIRALARFFLLRKGMSKSASNVFVSEDLRCRVPSNNGTVIWNGFDPNIFNPGLDYRLSGIPKQFAFVGRLVSEKGVPIALRGFAAARKRGLQARLRIIGEGPEQGEIRRLADSLGLRDSVEFLPFLSAPELARVYRESWAVVFPSQYREPFGIVIVESMACGCPVIASDHGAPPEVIGDTGLLVPAADVEAWAAAISAMANDPALRAHLAAAAAQRAHRDFGLEIMLDRYQRLLETICATRLST